MKTLLVVEGKSDTNRLKQVYEKIQTFETSGLGLDQKKIDYLKSVEKEYKIIVFTDPDGPGEIIRKKLEQELDNLYHAYLPNDKALSEKQNKIGVEHASSKDIKKALDNLYQTSDSNDAEEYQIADLIDWKLYQIKEKRQYLCDQLHIAFGNNQKLLKQLNNFNIKRARIEKIIKDYDGTSKHSHN